jgi:replication-associated recombination protein RarA
MNSFVNKSEVWTLKYRPMTLDDMILPKDMRNFFQRYKGGGSRQPLVLFGKPGTGKTQMANMLISGERVFLDCGRKDDTDRIRRMLYSASSYTLTGLRRSIIIDDCERLSDSSQHALREIERLTSINDFILTTNRIDLMDAPLRSRLAEICFDFSLDNDLKNQVIKRLEEVCEKESIEPPKRVSLEFLVRKHYPDMRKMIGELQKMINLR